MGDALDEGGSNDDAGTEVAGEEVHIDVDTQPSHTSSQDGEERGSGRYNEDHKEGGYAGTQATVVLVDAQAEVADNVSRVGSVEVDIGGVEISGHDEGEKVKVKVKIWRMMAEVSECGLGLSGRKAYREEATEAEGRRTRVL